MDTLILPGTLESLKPIRDYVNRAAEIAGLDRKAVYRLNLAVDEIATNIIMHGYTEANLDGDVVVNAEIKDGKLVIQLEDSGFAYNPSMDEQPDSIDQPLEQREEGGLGVYLAALNVDQFSYERVGDRNLHTFIVRINDESGV